MFKGKKKVREIFSGHILVDQTKWQKDGLERKRKIWRTFSLG